MKPPQSHGHGQWPSLTQTQRKIERREGIGSEIRRDWEAAGSRRVDVTGTQSHCSVPNGSSSGRSPRRTRRACCSTHPASAQPRRDARSDIPAAQRGALISWISTGSRPGAGFSAGGASWASSAIDAAPSVCCFILQA